MKPSIDCSNSSQLGLCRAPSTKRHNFRSGQRLADLGDKRLDKARIFLAPSFPHVIRKTVDIRQCLGSGGHRAGYRVPFFDRRCPDLRCTATGCRAPVTTGKDRKRISDSRSTTGKLSILVDFAARLEGTGEVVRVGEVGERESGFASAEPMIPRRRSTAAAAAAATTGGIRGRTVSRR